MTRIANTLLSEDRLLSLREVYSQELFNLAKSKKEIPDQVRKIVYKIYKKIKYNKDEEETVEVKPGVVDPVNDYILKKKYTNKVKLSKLERMKILAEHRKNQQRADSLFKEKEKENIMSLAKNSEKPIEEKVSLEDDENYELVENGDDEEDEYEEVEEVDGEEFEEDDFEEGDYEDFEDYEDDNFCDDSFEEEELEEYNFIKPKNGNGLQLQNKPKDLVAHNTLLNRKRLAADELVDPRKRKGSISSNGTSRKRVCFKLHNNNINGKRCSFNYLEYDRYKPISFTSSVKPEDIKNQKSPEKSLLRNKKNKKLNSK
jgi:hypothetical protein